MDPHILLDFKRYLEQQQLLYGDELFGLKPQHTEIDFHTLDEPAPILLPDFGTMPRKTDWTKATTLGELNKAICTCQLCPLGATRTKFVFGVGDPNADIVIVGEAPGADEDQQGEPFVGRAGKLLNDILKAIQIEREEVFICNILKCRPPGNRDPLPAEVELCEPYLHKQLEIIKPKIMLALGRIAAQTLLRTNKTLTALRAEQHTYQGIPLVVTFHPAALLRNPNWKRPTWEDVQKFRAMYDQLTGRK